MMYDNLGLVSSDSSTSTLNISASPLTKFATWRENLSRINFSIAGCLIFLALGGRRGYSRKTGERSLFSDYEGKLERGSHENPFKLEK